MPSRDDIKTFWALEIDPTAVGLEPAGAEDACFCTPAGAEVFARLGCDGVHFVLLPGDERVFCVDPAMGEPGSYALPVAEDFRQFLSFVLFCGDANPISQIWWMGEGRFRAFLKEEAERSWEGMGDLLERKKAAPDGHRRRLPFGARRPVGAGEGPPGGLRPVGADLLPGVLRGAGAGAIKDKAGGADRRWRSAPVSFVIS